MLAISKKVIHQNGFQDARFLQLLLNVVSEKFWLKSEALSINLLYPVEVRFASYLTSIVCDEQNCALNRSELKDTADLIGTSSRHLNRIIKAFIEDGMIERTETDIIIKNREKLIAIAKDIYN
ncbi:Crp/Fnr family transcriptional regulator [Brochothrix thermosphacta]|nr:helix-turn-helix domain-containing protein [Brochothrix thermosphacta]